MGAEDLKIALYARETPTGRLTKMAFAQKDVTQFYDSLVFPSGVANHAYAVLASDLIVSFRQGLREFR